MHTTRCMRHDIWRQFLPFFSFLSFSKNNININKFQKSNIYMVYLILRDSAVRELNYRLLSAKVQRVSEPVDVGFKSFSLEVWKICFAVMHQQLLKTLFWSRLALMIQEIAKKFRIHCSIDFFILKGKVKKR